MIDPNEPYTVIEYGVHWLYTDDDGRYHDYYMPYGLSEKARAQVEGDLAKYPDRPGSRLVIRTHTTSPWEPEQQHICLAEDGVQS